MVSCVLCAAPDRSGNTEKDIQGLTMARKTTTSTEVKRRYNERVYSRIYLQLPKETVEAFKAKCKHIGVSQASIILDAIEKFLRD